MKYLNKFKISYFENQNMKGQSSLEQLVITGLGIAFIAIIFYIALNFANDNTRISQAYDTVNKIAKSADYLYSLGPGTKDKLTVYMPRGIKSITISDNTIAMKVSLSSGDADVFANTKATLLGTITITSGQKPIQLTVLDSGKVMIGETSLACSPSTISKTLVQNATASDSITIENVGELQLTSVHANLSGNIADLISLNQPGATLNADATDTVGLSFSVPLGKSTGVYSGTVTVSGSGDSECSTSVTVLINSIGGEDASGPIVSSVAHSPQNLTISTPITITASGSDASTGGNTIDSCELDLDYSDVWSAMSASDGAFDEVTEDITYSLGTLGLGIHTVRLRCTDSQSNTGPATTYTFNVGSGGGGGMEDLAGPIVTYISHTPSNATTNSNITIYAIGNDSTTGGSTIAYCELELDYSGSWNSMSAVDGSYDETSENVTYSLGALSFGSHNVRVRCNDSLGYLGNPSVYGFSISLPGGGVGGIYNLLFVSAAETAGGTASEAKWIGWLYVYSVSNQLIWNIDVFSRSDVKDGTVDPNDYRIVIMSEAPNSDGDLYSILNTYKSSGHYIVAIGNVIKFGLNNFGVASGNGATRSGDEIKILSSHDAVNGYTVGNEYTILSSATNMYYHNSYSITSIAAHEYNDGYSVILDGSDVITWGVIDPDFMNSDGDVIFGQILEYALANSG